MSRDRELAKLRRCSGSKNRYELDQIDSLNPNGKSERPDLSSLGSNSDPICALSDVGRFPHSSGLLWPRQQILSVTPLNLIDRLLAIGR